MSINRLGVDVGGTFNDFVLLDRGTITYWKELGETDRAAQMAKAVNHQAKDSGQLGEFVHGSTIAINALLERTHQAPALITTAGFEDILILRRQRRPDLYRQWVHWAPPLVPRELVFGVSERLDARGTVLRPIDETEVENVALGLPRGTSSVAICLLHSYANPKHEQAVEDVLRRLRPELEVVLSSVNAAEIREFERASTVAADAYLRQILDSYFSRLSHDLAPGEFIKTKWVMQSAGGRTGFDNAVRFPTNTLQSGPAAGVVGATLTAERSGYTNLITLDVGGTSTDVALVRDGHPVLVYDREVGDTPLLGPTIDIHSIGAGGGSLITVDEGGLLHVGPESAGAVPGPACYGQGGEYPTLADAAVLLGLLPSSRSIAGGLRLSKELAEKSFSGLAELLDEEPIGVAAAAVEIATESTVNAIRLVSVERGYDPREYVLVAYGGAGPLLAAEVGHRLGSPAVLFPFAPGVLSAFGLLAASTRVDSSRTILVGEDDTAVVENVRAELTEQLRLLLPAEDRDRATPELTLDMRYEGQNWQVPVYVPGDITKASLRKAFEESYEGRYGVTLDRPLQYVTVRVALSVPKSTVEFLDPPAPASTEPEWSNAYMGSELLDVAIWAGGILNEVSGPSLVCLKDATITVPPSTILKIAKSGYLLEWGRES